MEPIAHPEVIPLEVWDLWVDGEILWDRLQGPGPGTALERALEELRAGRGSTRSEGPMPAVVGGFEALFATGGRIGEAKLREALGALPFPVFFGEEGAFAGESAGFELLSARGTDGWVVDLGQRQLKVSAPGRRWTAARDFSRLPIADRVPLEETPAQRQTLREFIAGALSRILEDGCPRPRAVVFALPARLAAGGTPEGSSYAGMRGDLSLVEEALELAGLGGVPALTVNDAVLAALGARTDARLSGYRKVLVLTLGFGAGAALIFRQP